MRITFDLTLEEAVAFNVEHQNRLPTVRAIRSTLSAMAGISVPVGVAVYLCLSSDAGDAESGLGATRFLVMWAVTNFLVFGALAWLAARGRFRGQFINKFLIRRMLSERGTSGFVGEYEISYSATEVTERSPVGQSTYPIASVLEITISDEFVSLYISSAQALVIPKRAFESSEQCEQFACEIEEYRQAALQNLMVGAAGDTHNE